MNFRQARKHYILIGLLVCVLLKAEAQRKAVFIIVDGIPADVIERVSTPVLDQIKAKGGYTRSFVGGAKDEYSQSPTISAVGYNHVLTGTWTNKHNVWDNDIAEPNYHYWNVFRIVKEYNPKLQTAIFSSWTDNRTKLAGEGLPAAGSLKLDYSYDGLELDTVRFPHRKDGLYMFNIDEAVSTEAGRYILEKGPDLSWVYLEYTDDMGHRYGDSPETRDAIQKADTQIGRIWNAIQAREKQFGEEWMIVITTDHGRDAATGHNHGGQSDRERTTWITTNVNNLNAHFTETPGAVDIAPSILSFMKIGVPKEVSNEMDGVSFTGPVSVSNLKASRQDKKVLLTWNVLNAKGKAEIRITATNNFKTGTPDVYKTVGTVAVKQGRFEFVLPDSASAFQKIMLVAPDNTINVWLTK
ncbi:MAG: alkaline phosphatase family protein [Cyclobacteriaceae bacterium]